MKSINVLALAFVALIAPVAHGDYEGLTVVREFPSQMTAAGVRDVFRVYAEFTNPTDRIDSWYGASGHPFTIQNVLADGVTLGSGFTNIGGSGSNLPPETSGGQLDWDTWATIGITNGDEGPDGGDHAALTFGFPTFISGNSVTSSNASVFLPIGDPQGRADWRIVGQDTNLRVLLMQLVVLPGQHVRGTINISGLIATSSSGFESFNFVDQTFNSVPGAGPLALFGCSCLLSRRRRRFL